MTRIKRKYFSDIFKIKSDFTNGCVTLLELGDYEKGEYKNLFNMIYDEINLRYYELHIYNPDRFTTDIIIYMKRQLRQIQLLNKALILELGDLEKELVTKSIGTSTQIGNETPFQFSGIDYQGEISDNQQVTTSENYRLSTVDMLKKLQNSKLTSGIKELVSNFSPLFSRVLAW